MVFTQSGRCPCWLKLATVVGSSSSEEAKIGGITPEVLSGSGRCEDCPSNMRLPTGRLGYWMSSGRWALNEHDECDARDRHDGDEQQHGRRQRTLARHLEGAG